MATPKQQQKRVERDSPSTPLSPSLNTRKDEKEQMVNLNNRMAVYVEKVRSLETENSRLQIQITSYEQTSIREVNNMKAMYESELGEARRLLDELSKEKAQLQIEATSYREKYEVEKNRANGLAHDNGVLEGKLKDVDSILSVKDAQYSRIKKERDDLCEELESLKGKFQDIKGELETTQQMLESETLQRVDFENKLQSIKEELLFKERLFQEEISEVRKRHCVSVTEIDQQVKVDYESRLEAAIMDLREQQQCDMEQMREDLDHQYSYKITDLTKQLDNACKLHLKSQEVYKTSELKVDRLQNTIRTLQTQALKADEKRASCLEDLKHQNNNLTNRVQDLEGQVETEREVRITAVLTVEKQRDEVREKLRQMEKEYGDLLDLKVKLDHEIGVYRKLLEEEEQRLNLSPSPHVGGTDSKGRGRTRRKRKRVIAQSEGESRAKKKEITTTTFTSETVTVEKTQAEVGREDVLHQQPEPSPEGNNSCIMM